MNSTMFSGRMNILSGSECGRCVERARFIVAPNANGHARSLHLSPDFLGQGVSFKFRRIGGEKQATNAQIEDKTRRSAQIFIQYGGKLRSIVLQPVDEDIVMRDRG